MNVRDSPPRVSDHCEFTGCEAFPAQLCVAGVGLGFVVGAGDGFEFGSVVGVGCACFVVGAPSVVPSAPLHATPPTSAIAATTFRVPAARVMTLPLFFGSCRSESIV